MTNYFSTSNISLKRADWCSVKIIELYFEGTRLESRQGYRLSWIFSWFSSVSQGKFQDSTSKYVKASFFHILTSLRFHHSRLSSHFIRCYQISATQRIFLSSSSEDALCQVVSGRKIDYWNRNPPYFPDLASNDFWLFPEIKSALKGRRFQDKKCDDSTENYSTIGVPKMFLIVGRSV